MPHTFPHTAPSIKLSDNKLDSHSIPTTSETALLALIIILMAFAF